MLSSKSSSGNSQSHVRQVRIRLHCSVFSIEQPPRCQLQLLSLLAQSPKHSGSGAIRTTGRPPDMTPIHLRAPPRQSRVGGAALQSEELVMSSRDLTHAHPIHSTLPSLARAAAACRPHGLSASTMRTTVHFAPLLPVRLVRRLLRTLAECIPYGMMPRLSSSRFSPPSER